MPNESITLNTTFTNGSGGQAKLYRFAQLDAEGNPLTNPPNLVATSNQESLVKAFTRTTDPALAANEVDIRAVGKAPANIPQALITVSDGRFINGQPVQYQVTVLIAQLPNLSSITPASSDPIRNL